MKKVSKYIVKYRYIILSLFIVFSLFCLYLNTKVNINDDIMKYLPKDSETKIGNDIMNESFNKQSSSELNVMFKDLTKKEKVKTYEKLTNVSGVASVSYDNTSKYNKGKYTLYKVNVSESSDSKTATKVYNDINKNFKVSAMNGSIYDQNKPVLKTWIVAVAIISALIILILLSDSWFEPVLYLISIGIAVFINKGTNIMFDSVSSITNSIVAVLQLALSMDYSIMLSNRFKQEKKKESSKTEAMEKALYKSFKSITSSSLTTVVGLLALIFMSFTIGKDLGIILAKGVLLSLVCIFLCLPALLLLFDNVITKSKKKIVRFKLEKLSSYCYKYKFVHAPIVILLFVFAFILKGNVNVLFTGIQQDEVGKVFKSNNQIAIVYESKYKDDVTNYIYNLYSDKNIDGILSYDLLFKRELSSDELSNLITSLSPGTNIDEDIIRFVYYTKFDGKIYDNISINELLQVINSNDLLKEYASKNYNLNELSKFFELADMNKKYSVDTLSNMINISKEELSLIYLMYNSKTHYDNEYKMTFEEVISYIKENVINNDKYSKYIPSTKKGVILVALNKINDAKGIFVSDKYERVVLNTSYKSEGKETFKFVEKLEKDLGSKKGIYIVGESPMANEMSKSFMGELNKITIITIVFIFIVVAFTFKDLIIPFVLVLMIQSAVYITMSYISLTGGNVYFIALLIVQAILMGATIDYAIVYTSYYRESRLKRSIKESILKAYKGSIQTILSSSSVLIIVTMIVGSFADAISAVICDTISKGTICSLILVVLVLPGVLAAFDKLICRKGYYKEDETK